MTSNKACLSATNIRSLPAPIGRSPRLHADGANGLYLQIMPRDTRSFIFRYTIKGRTRAMGLGSISSTTLSDARKRARELRVQTEQGIDPLAERNVQRANAQRTLTQRITFKRCAELYIQTHRPGWKSDKHAQQWENTLAQYAYPVIGQMSVAEIGVEEIKKVLVPIWSRINETASRLRARIEKVFGWATVQGHRSGENPARWTGFLSEIFAKRSLIHEVRHHGALPYVDSPAFIAEIRGKGTLAALLLEFIMLTVVRTTEARAATWDEIDFDAKIWTIPGPRMKGKKPHRVPLSEPVVTLLLKLKGLRDTSPPERRSNFVFPSPFKPSQCLSNMAALAFVNKSMKREDITPHGMRSTFRDWAAECTDFPREVAEAALAHTLQNKVEAAYQRGDFLIKRRALMDAWAAFLL